jgi:hypothetical protein
MLDQKRNTAFFALAATLAGSACRPDSEVEPLSPQEVRARAGISVDETGHHLDTALTFATNLRVFEALFEVSDMTDVDAAVEARIADEGQRSALKSAARRISQSPAFWEIRGAGRRMQHHFDPRAGASASRRSMANEEGNEFEEASAEIKAYLIEKVFIDENVLEVDGDTTIYRLSGDALCSFEGEDAEASDGEIDDFPNQPRIDQECIDDVEAMKLALAVKGLGDDGLSIGLLVGAAQHRPFELELESDRVALEVDLAQVKSALQSIGEAVEQTIDVPETLDGEFKCTVEMPGAEILSAACSVSRAIELVVAGQDEAGESVSPMRFHLEAADPLIWATVDAANQSLEGGINSGAVDLSLTEDEFETELPDEGRRRQDGRAFDYHLAGCTATASMAQGSPNLEVKQVGLGASSSYLDVDSKRAVTIDLQRDYQRQFDVGIEPDEATGSAVFTFGGPLQFEVQYDLSVVDGESESGAEIFSFLLDGDDSPQIFPYWSEQGSVLEIRRGQATLHDSANSLLAPAGQCIVDNPDTSSDETSLILTMSVAQCPAPLASDGE